MKHIVLYSTGCPKCQVLKKKLDQKGIVYEENNDIEDMSRMGITVVPQLAVGESALMDFKSAVDFVNAYEGDD